MHVSTGDYSHTFQASRIAEAQEGVYKNFINAEEKRLEARYSQSPSTANDPANQNYATIEVAGKTVAKITNSGVVETGSSFSGKIRNLLAGVDNTLKGPALAEERVAKIAEAFGGEVVKAASALTQAQFNATPGKPAVNYTAMQEDPAYEQLQKTKEARTLFLAQQMGQDTGGEEKAGDEEFILDTAHGKKMLDVGEYFMPKSGPIDLDKVPLLLPTANNIDALSTYVSGKIQKFLATHNIPEGPAKITYDNNGQIKLPYDYPHADKFKQALEADPAMARGLQTISSLTSSYVALQGAIQGDSSKQGYSEIALKFANDGTLRVTADGKSYNKNSFVNKTTDTAKTSDTVKTSGAEQAFLDYMNKTPSERYFEAMLKQEGLTKEQFDALPPEEQAEITEKIQKKMKGQIEATVETTQNTGTSVVSPRSRQGIKSGFSDDMMALYKNNPDLARKSASSLAYGNDFLLIPTPTSRTLSDSTFFDGTPVTDTVYVDKFNKEAQHYQQQRINLYESEKAKGTSDIDILAKMFDFYDRLPTNYKQKIGYV